MHEFSIHIVEQMHRTSRLTFTPILPAQVAMWKEDRVMKVNVIFGMSSVTNFITNAPPPYHIQFLLEVCGVFETI